MKFKARKIHFMIKIVRKYFQRVKSLKILIKIQI